MDEIHAWREYHREFYDTMVTGSGYRDQPLISYITTAGDDKSHLWMEIYEHAKAVVLGEVEDESFFTFSAELDEEDDPLDEANWIKANPNLGVSVSVDYLREQAAKCTNSIATNRFTRYHGNRKVSSIASAFNIEQWDACRSELSDWSQADAFGAGVDLGGRDDLAAYAIVARFPTGETDEDDSPVWRYEAKCKVYIAENTKRDMTQAPFANWVYSDHIHKCKHPIAELKNDLLADCADLGVSTLAFDPYNAQQLSEELSGEGMTAARMAQTYAMFNEPILDLIAAIEDGRFAHDGSPVLRWAAKNAITVTDKQLRVMFDKSSCRDKIDPIVATTMAFRICSLAASRPTGSLYL
jgi:phage terminase large subunit-like protein